MGILKNNSGKVNSIIYMLSSVVTFVLAFFINVIMTNHSGSNDIYGRYKYATNFILTVPAIFSFGITWSCASLIARDDLKDKDGVITVSIIFIMVVGIIVTIGMYIISRISVLLGHPLFGDAVIVFPFATVFLVQNLVNLIYTGAGQAVKLSVFNMAPNIIIYVGMCVYVAIFGTLNYTYAILVYLFSYALAIIPKLLEIHYNFKEFKQNAVVLLHDVKSSGLKVYLSSIFTTSSTQIIALVCGNIYGYAEYGYYSLAASLAIVFQLIGSSLAIVNFKQYANTDRIAKRDFIFMLVLGVAAYAFMFLIIDVAFFWFYPKSYEPAILYLRLLCLSNLIYGFSALFNRFFIGKGLGGKVMKNSFITVVATIVIYIPMIFVFGMKGMAVAAIVVSVISLIAYLFDYIKYQKELCDNRGRE